MFSSSAPYILLGLSAFMLLVAIFAPGKKRVKAPERRTDIPVTFAPVEEVFLSVEEMPKERVERVGVLTIDMTTLQLCAGCRSVWLGEYVRSEQCPKCKGQLLAIVAEGAPQQYVVVSEERLAKLLLKMTCVSSVACA